MFFHGLMSNEAHYIGALIRYIRVSIKIACTLYF